MHRIMLAAAFSIAAMASFTTFESIAIAAPNPAPAQVTNDVSSPIIQIDRRCGRGRHYVGRHRYHGHWVAGRCARG
jgi:hypothetical protein